MDIISEKIQKSKEGEQKKIDEKLSLEQKIIGKEQEPIPAIKKKNDLSKTKPVNGSSTKQIKEQTAATKGTARRRQIKILADLAMEKGVHYAVAMAKKIDNAYILDELHDTLIDELYEELKSRGLL
ncbi:MAG: hypothetical protein US76_00340 [Parcubacteria group bacterium GW2011_GWA2_38_13b]|nr:MAG: hypothetical protein US76_00340 [Parcubacteria group bacterium GW2011_GWA2_38_13b]